jgi:hypothetical protein
MNTVTGEILFSEFPTTTSINVKDSDLAIVDYDEFITIDSKALRYILTLFNQADISRILKMADMVKGVYNILHDSKGSAYSPQSLRLSLSYNAAEFSRFLKRRHSKSVIHNVNGYKDDRKCKWIMLNPSLARKRKTFHKECLNVFDRRPLEKGSCYFTIQENLNFISPTAEVRFTLHLYHYRQSKMGQTRENEEVTGMSRVINSHYPLLV